ncbi:MAG: FecR domain-containing protein [Phycisphaerae bacterium]|nr:FecR domain-containing protein [Phycisphaerae bacterium]
MTPAEKKNLFELLELLREDLITDQQFEMLDEILAADTNARLFYVHYAKMCSELYNFQEAKGNITLEHLTEKIASTEDDFIENNLLAEIICEHDFADEESEEDDCELQQKLARERILGLRKDNNNAYRRSRLKLSGISRFLGAIAAMLIVATCLTLIERKAAEPIIPRPIQEIPFVATITDVIDARWANGSNYAIDSTLRRGPKTLQSGYAEITLNDGVMVVVEGPCEFEFDKSNHLVVYSGNITANVPRKAIGFKVITPYATIMDLGTEFGVSVNKNHYSEVHVFDGEVKLFAGEGQPEAQEQIIRQGGAKYVNVNSTQISDAQYRNDLFARRIVSKERLVWRGEKIDLADVVGGGNGFGTGMKNSGIDPGTGHHVSKITYAERKNQGFVKVGNSPFIDGLFVPDGQNYSCEITSTGLCFTNCPDTLGVCFADLNNCNMMSIGSDDDSQQIELLFNKQRFNYPSRTLISMHANIGVTFDLDEFRNMLSGAKLERFSAEAGLSESAMHDGQFYMTDEDFANSDHATASFWVLVDGQLRFQSPDQHPRSGSKKVDVKLKPEDRFLTLIVTDSDMATGRAWGLFAMPTLEFK